MASIRSITTSFLNLKHINSKLRYNVRLFSNSRTNKVQTDLVKMPSLSPTMNDGSIVKWYKNEGELIEAGEIICDIQTDKAVVSFETDDDIILAKILKPEGTSGIEIGDTIALSVSPADKHDYKSAALPAGTEAPSSQAPGQDNPSYAAAAASGAGYGPAVRTLLEVYDIEVAEVKGTGPASRLIKGDILQYIADNNLKPAPVKTVTLPQSGAKQATAAEPTPQSKSVKKTTAKSTSPSPAAPTPVYDDLELTSMRKAIARRLTLSKTSIPHSYASVECDMTAVIELRQQLKEQHNTKISVNDFIIKASAVALKAVPEVNASYDVGSGAITRHASIDIATAVATPNGLITPIVRNSAGLGLAEISNTVRHLAGKAREGTLQPDEFEGGTFTVSNLGMFGISEFTAIINPPQSSILSVGRNEPQLKIVEGEVRDVEMLTCALSADARVIDEFTAAKFLDQFKRAMETPILLMV